MKKTLTLVPRTKRPSLDAIDRLAATVLAFLAADTGRFDRFLALTGLDVGSLRVASTASGFTESLLDYLCSDEALLLAYASESRVDPAEIAAMRLSLAPAPFDG